MGPAVNIGRLRASAARAPPPRSDKSSSRQRYVSSSTAFTDRRTWPFLVTISSRALPRACALLCNRYKTAPGFANNSVNARPRESTPRSRKRSAAASFLNSIRPSKSARKQGDASLSTSEINACVANDCLRVCAIRNSAAPSANTTRAAPKTKAASFITSSATKNDPTIAPAPGIARTAIGTCRRRRRRGARLGRGSPPRDISSI